MARPSLSKHRKFLRLVAMLKAPRSHARGYLELIWESAYERGEPHLGDAIDVELAADWPGEKGELARALVDCGGDGLPGFLVEEDGAFRVHDLFDHAPDYVRKRRIREIERLTAVPYNVLAEAHRAAHLDLDRPGVEALRQGTAPFIQIDDKNGAVYVDPRISGAKKAKKDLNGTPPTPTPKEEDKKDMRAGGADRVAQICPCKGGKTWELLESKLAEWRDSFPDVDIDAEVRRAVQWLRDNPSKRKTPRGMTRFFGAWLGRAEKKRGSRRRDPGGENPRTRRKFDDLDDALRG